MAPDNFGQDHSGWLTLPIDMNEFDLLILIRSRAKEIEEFKDALSLQEIVADLSRWVTSYARLQAETKLRDNADAATQ